MMLRVIALARFRSKDIVSRRAPTLCFHVNKLSTEAKDSPGTDKVVVSQSSKETLSAPAENEKIVTNACGDIGDDDDDEMEQEEMFVEAHESFEHKMAEWGGPRRGGRLPEPTRFGDWERKGRCTDF